MNNTLKRSWLIQRLNRPHSFNIAGKSVDNPFSFGGGYKNGGLSEEAMSLVRPIMSFDYMGAAEFEFGAVPEAFNKITHHEHLSAWSYSIGQAKRDWTQEEPEDCDTTIYVLAPLEWRQEVESRLYEWATDPSVQMKEPTRLGRALLPKDEWDSEIRGWLELDNGFMVFIDEEMWRKSSELFGADFVS